MAFVALPSINALPKNNAMSSSCTHRSIPCMTTGRMNRRAALSVFGLSLTVAASSAMAGSFDLKELKEDVEALKYDEEVTDVGPDANEKNPTRIKKKVEAPSYKSEEAELIKSEEKKYDEMVEKELEEEAALKAKFSKSRSN